MIFLMRIRFLFVILNFSILNYNYVYLIRYHCIHNSFILLLKEEYLKKKHLLQKELLPECYTEICLESNATKKVYSLKYIFNINNISIKN